MPFIWYLYIKWEPVISSNKNTMITMIQLELKVYRSNINPEVT